MIDLYTYLGDDDDIDILVVAVSEVSLHSNDLQVFCSFLCSHHQAYKQEKNLGFISCTLAGSGKPIHSYTCYNYFFLKTLS